MKSFQTPHTVANEVRLKRSQHAGPFLLVEGSDDSRFYRRFIDTQSCQLIPAFNKENVIGAVTVLEDTNFSGVLGVVDSDFDVLMNRDLASANIVRGDDSHDLETMLLRSPALDAVLHEYASPEKLRMFEARNHIPFRRWLVQAGLCLGYLRWYSAKSGTNLCFDGLRFSRFIDMESLALDRSAMFAEIKNRSQNWTITDAELTEAGWPQNRNDDPWYVCCGHDLVDLLVIALRRAIGSRQQLSADDLSRSLRLAYGESDFGDSTPYLRIREWEILNGFRVLR